MGARMAATSRRREYPFFFSYAILQVLRSLIELGLRGNSYRSYRIYFGYYWVAEAVIVLLNFVVLYEIARSVLRPYPSLSPWVRAFQLEVTPASAKFAPHGQAFNLHDWNRSLGGLLRR